MSERHIAANRAPRLCILGVSMVLLVGCSEEEWRGFVYPNKSDLTQYRVVGVYNSLDQRRSAALAVIVAGGWGAQADNECGLICEPSSLSMICERTAR